jgi:hypothetical protein
MAYIDELEPLLEREQELRRAIALTIAEERGESVAGAPTQDQTAAADEAIEAWSEEFEFEHDMRAFRPLTPLQHLLAEHDAIRERIMDIHDRRLS